MMQNKMSRETAIPKRLQCASAQADQSLRRALCVALGMQASSDGQRRFWSAKTDRPYMQIYGNCCAPAQIEELVEAELKTNSMANSVDLDKTAYWSVLSDCTH